jgi:hypothetical protein
VFFAKVRGEHHETEEVVESRTMVYVIEGDIILVSRAITPYLRLLQQLMTSPNMLTPAPMLPWPVRPATRPAIWLGQDLAHQRWLGRSSRRKM